MTNFKVDSPYLNKFGIGTVDKIPKKHIDFLKNNINKDNKSNHLLAGHIDKEYHYRVWPKSFEEWIVNTTTKNKEVQGHLNSIKVLSKNVPYSLNSLWINLQQKYEFNPFHDHSGVLSFIIFLQVPYDLKKEDKVFAPTSAVYHTSRLSFATTQFNKMSWVLANVDKSYVNKMLVFPASLHHEVYPFYTSDDYRITVSGNIALYTG
tara:strand:+ start:870 stop:1487 length:618 start_codon:yes stop_codon:yes gene_type:complete